MRLLEIGYRRRSALTDLTAEYRHDMHTHVHNMHSMDTYHTHTYAVDRVDEVDMLPLRL